MSINGFAECSEVRDERIAKANVTRRARVPRACPREGVPRSLSRMRPVRRNATTIFEVGCPGDPARPYVPGVTDWRSLVGSSLWGYAGWGAETHFQERGE